MTNERISLLLTGIILVVVGVPDSCVQRASAIADASSRVGAQRWIISAFAKMDAALQSQDENSVKKVREEVKAGLQMIAMQMQQ